VPHVLTDGDTDPGNGEQPTTFVATAQGASGEPVLSLTKHVELNGDTNNDGLLNPGESFRYSMVLSNMGSSPASGVTLTDQIPAHVTLVPGSVHTSRGAVVSEDPVSVNIGRLGVGESVNVYFEVRVDRGAPLGTTISNQAQAGDGSGHTVISDDPGTDDGRDCTSSASNCNDGDGGNDDPTDVVVSGANIFDPPMAEKTGTLGDQNVITWRQVWINSGNTQAINVRVTDPIPEHTSYVDGSLVCSPQGSSTTVRCQYDAQNNRIIWEGNIGADFNATDEDQAQNEVVIEFNTLVTQFAPTIENHTTGYWDRDGDGFIDDDIDAGQVAITSEAAVSLLATVPTLSQWGAIFLMVALALAVIIKRKILLR